jgi:hypothetical protein
VLVDTFEPETIYRGILAELPEASRAQLNTHHKADYFFFSITGHSIQIERKQWSEVLGGMPRVEEQLSREYTQADSTSLLIEGVAIPTTVGMDTYKVRECKLCKGKKPTCFICRGKVILTQGFSYGTPKKPQFGLWSKLQAWLWQIDKAGISIYYAPTENATASLLVSIYRNAQKLEHRTLKRYIRPKQVMEARDPHVLTLMGLVDPKTMRTFIGEKTAKALLYDHDYGTPYYIFNEDPGDLMKLHGIGPGLVQALWRSIGRRE